MLQNARLTTFTVSELLKENQQSGLKLPPPFDNQIMVKVKVAQMFLCFTKN